jgi:hypothetical protein
MTARVRRILTQAVVFQRHRMPLLALLNQGSGRADGDEERRASVSI